MKAVERAQVSGRLYLPWMVPVTPHEAYEAKERRFVLGKALRRLSDVERRIVALRFGSEMTRKDIGARIGRSAARVQQIEQRALIKLGRIRIVRSIASVEGDIEVPPLQPRRQPSYQGVTHRLIGDRLLSLAECGLVQPKQLSDEDICALWNKTHADA